LVVIVADDVNAGPRLDTRSAIAPFGVVDDALDISCRTDVVVELDGADC